MNTSPKPTISDLADRFGKRLADMLIPSDQVERHMNRTQLADVCAAAFEAGAVAAHAADKKPLHAVIAELKGLP